jgi:hypothetical protein
MHRLRHEGSKHASGRQRQTRVEVVEACRFEAGAAHEHDAEADPALPGETRQFRQRFVSRITMQCAIAGDHPHHQEH